MLAQILHDLYVPRDLLDGLSEDQRQLLFCKMREEQVRRYHEREDDGALTINSVNRSKKKKKVTFRLDGNGNEYCLIIGESKVTSKVFDEKSNDKSTNENDSEQLRTIAGVNHSLQTKPGTYFTAHRDERKQIEEISNNIQEARRLFECLESETRRLVMNKESELLQQQNQRFYLSPDNVQNDTVDETFYREMKERAKKADRERREAARRARDNFRQNSVQLNVCFDTDNHTTILFQPAPFTSSNPIKRKPSFEKTIHIELVDKKPPSTTNSSSDNSRTIPIERDLPLLAITENDEPKSSSPLTREDIRQWFCLTEIPYRTFRALNGQIYPWFHGIITRSYAEQLLSSKPIGSYLIRINERIYGYALSYRASDHCRHLLIEVISTPNQNDNPTQQHIYRFLGGARSETFTELNQLIEKYSTIPIRSNSTDVLRYPCGQLDPLNPDYADLFIENLNNRQYEPLYISLDTTTSSPHNTTHL